MDTAYAHAEDQALREPVRRFIAREVEPHALAWEAAGHAPREVLRKMRCSGRLGLMYAPDYGGAGADALSNLVFAEALSTSTVGGFIINALVHTDMDSPHLHHAGTPAQLAMAPSCSSPLEPDRVFQAVMKNFQTERIALAAMAVGHCQRALRLALEPVGTRQAFGAPLWDKPTQPT
jgi:alkylation response protein AidB-like acyl-CoA dehydrogenase